MSSSGVGRSPVRRAVLPNIQPTLGLCYTGYPAVPDLCGHTENTGLSSSIVMLLLQYNNFVIPESKW